MIRTILFDLDDTLYDYKSAEKKADDALYAYMRRQFSLSRAQAERIVRESGKRLQKRLGPRAAIHSRLVRYLEALEKEGLPFLPQAVEMDRLYWEAFLGNVRLWPGTAPFLEALRRTGTLLGIGSNMTMERQLEKLDRLGISSCFDYVVCSQETDKEKPDPSFFSSCLEIGSWKADSPLRARQALFIGDDPQKDVEGAYRAGLFPVYYNPRAAGPPALDPSCYDEIRSYEACVEKEGVRIGRHFFPYA